MLGPSATLGLTRENTPASTIPGGWQLESTVVAEDIPSESSSDEESHDEDSCGRIARVSILHAIDRGRGVDVQLS